MFGKLVAALSVVFALWAGQGLAADYVTATFVEAPFTVYGPLAALQTRFPICAICTEPNTAVANDGREVLNWQNGSGGHLTGSFTFDADQGVLTSTASDLHFVSTSPDPILAGSFSFPFLPLDRDLSDATSLTIDISSVGAEFSIVGPTYVYSERFDPRGLGIPTTLSGLYGFEADQVAVYEDGTYRIDGSQGISLTLADNPTFTPSVPEPTTWALLIAGFGLVGFRLRRCRAAGLGLRSIQTA